MAGRPRIPVSTFGSTKTTAVGAGVTGPKLGSATRTAGHGKSITSAAMVLRVMVAGLLGLSVWQGWSLVRGVRIGDRRWAPTFRSRWKSRTVPASVAVLALLGLAWAAAQPYLMLSSVFPGISGRAVWAAAALAVVNLLSASAPRSTRGPRTPPP